MSLTCVIVLVECGVVNGALSRFRDPQALHNMCFRGVKLTEAMVLFRRLHAVLAKAQAYRCVIVGHRSFYAYYYALADACNISLLVANEGCTPSVARVVVNAASLYAIYVVAPKKCRHIADTTKTCAQGCPCRKEKHASCISACSCGGIAMFGGHCTMPMHLLSDEDFIINFENDADDEGDEE